MASIYSNKDRTVSLESIQPHSGSKFKQQNLHAWQPILKGNTAYPIFVIIGVIFIPLGVELLVISNQIKEFSYDYTYCIDNVAKSGTCADFITNRNKTGQRCHCSITTELEKISEPVFIYYGLTNYYQNHRRFVRSRDDNQLHGDKVSPENLKIVCDPYKTVIDNETVVYGIAPCGTIANSLFNDTFQITYGNKVPVKLIRTGIALKADKNYKFKNPSNWALFKKPPNWIKPVWMLDPNNTANNGYKNEDLIVWMRTAAMPTFRKLYRRVNHDAEPFVDGLPAGNYTINIEYNYPVAIFNGQKKIIISTTSIFGGKNSFLGVTYMIVGSISLIVGVVFFIINNYCGVKTTSTKVKIVKFY